MPNQRFEQTARSERWTHENAEPLLKRNTLVPSHNAIVGSVRPSAWNAPATDNMRCEVHVTIDELKREALQLDPETRADLAHVLLNSLDTLSDAQVERLWLEEAARPCDRRIAVLDTCRYTVCCTVYASIRSS